MSNDNAFIFSKLTHYQPKLLAESPIAAAVMILLLGNKCPPLEIVLTKRALHLLTYAGHYSFPGGMKDVSDDNLLTTAKREVTEELNIPPQNYQVLGQLDDFLDHDSHLVRPFIANMPKEIFEQHCKISPDEISELYFFPITKLHLIHEDPNLYKITGYHPNYSFKEGNVFIWGLTARMLVHLDNIIHDKKRSLKKIY